MSVLEQSLVLPGEVQLVPIETYPEQTRSQFSYEPGDVAITRRRSRTPTKIISADLASLLEQFSSERTVVEAILIQSARQSMNPRELLDEAFPFIQQMVGERLLVPASEAAKASDRNKYERGDAIGRYTIVRSMQSLLDTELFQVRDESGQIFALKLARPDENPMIGYALVNEGRILQFLEGDVAPRFVDQGTEGSHPYLVMSWIAGIDAGSAAAELRLSEQPAERLKLLNLTIAIAGAYEKLHARNVIHGDIHPGNILIERSGDAYLIDFGLARMLEGSDRGGPVRGGVAFFAEPESCKASLANQAPPPANALGEQYGLAALLYHLITGAHYLDFSLEQDVMWRQIVEGAPLPFSHHRVQPWPEVEMVLNKALSKDPEERYRDVAAFRSALREATVKIPVDDRGLSLPMIGEKGSLPFIEGVLRRVALDGPLLRDGLPRTPTASVNYGAAGIAYFLYRLACARNDPALLSLADIWATTADELAGTEGGFNDEEFEISEETVGRISPFHSRSGLYVNRFLLAQAVGDEATQATALAAYVHEADQAEDELDLTLGKSSVLMQSAFLYDLAGSKRWVEESGLLELGNKYLGEIWQTLDSHGPIDRTGEVTNLGIAHGWAGFLYATLTWCHSTGTPLASGVMPRLRQLAAYAEARGRGLEWPWDLGHPQMSYMAGWCNGSAGYVYLWSEAYDRFKDEHWLDLAIGSGWNAWEAQAQAVNLCCGLAGRSYALLRLHRLTGDQIWLERARVLGRQAALNAGQALPGHFEGFENSLYKGEVGVAALLLDLERPEYAAMPFFESIDRP